MSLNSCAPDPDNILLQNSLEIESPSSGVVVKRKIFKSSRFNYIMQNHPSKTFYYVVIIALLSVIAISSFFPKNNHSKETLLSSSKSSIYLTSLPSLRSSKDNSTYESPHNFKLFLSDAYQLRMYDLKTNKSSLYHEVLQSIILFDIVKSSVFFIENNNPLIQSTNVSFVNVTIHSHITPQAMAIDSLTKKFYILDKSAGTINVMNFEGKYFGIVLSGIEDLHDIVLDVDEGYMFILQYEKSILRINLDGTDVQEIVKDNKITAFTIDRLRKHILWADTDFNILKVDYNGKKHTIITAIKTFHLINGLAYYDNQLFWIEKSSNQGLWSCEYDHIDICINHKNFPMFYKNLTAIKIFMDEKPNENRVDNPCLVDNGNCSQFCFLSPNKDRTCACTTGYQLDSDLQSCKQDTRDFILYSTSHYLRGIAINTIDRDTFRDVIIPNPNAKNLTYFDYDVENDDFYFQANSKVQVMNIKKESDIKTIISKNTDTIAYDWASRNLYYIHDHKGDIWLHHNNVFKQITENGSFVDIMLDVGTGRLFSINYITGYFQTRTLGGLTIKEEKIPIYFDSRLVFDRVVHDMYFVHLNNRNLYSLDSGEDYYLNVNDMTQDYPYAPSFYGGYLYIRNYSGIWRVKKNEIDGTGALVTSSFGQEKIKQMKIFKRGIDYSNGTKSECEINNGGCEHFCFAKPTKYCGCADNYKLSDDEKKCVYV